MKLSLGSNKKHPIKITSPGNFESDKTSHKNGIEAVREKTRLILPHHYLIRRHSIFVDRKIDSNILRNYPVVEF